MLTLLSLFFGSAIAGDVVLFAGLSADARTSLGLGVPTFIDSEDGWRATAPGGWVLHHWNVDATAAEGDFLFQVSTVQARLPAIAITGADQAVGDDGFVVARRGNVVVQVRGAGAPARTATLLAAETAESTVVGPLPTTLDGAGTSRDTFGRLSLETEAGRPEATAR
ncbi:MAG: hypothetical protein EXR71_13555 [Myxococcales bacterium]|nr:hypothetical protein [Myxococcales bacterium]